MQYGEQLASGDGDHLTSDLDRLAVHERYGGKDKVHAANGAGMSISHIGHSTISGSSSKPLYLRNILHVPHVNKHLLSVHKLVSDNDTFTEFHPHFFSLKDRATKAVLLQSRCRNGLYPVPSYKQSSLVSGPRALSSVRLSSDLWHTRLGHPSKNVVDSVLRVNKFACAPSTNSSVCDACQRAKVHQLPFRDSTHVTHAPLEIIHSDVWGPAIISVGGFKYYVSFLDDYSRFTWIYLLKHKSDVEQAFYTFQKHVERMLDAKIKTVQTDWGGEYRRLSRLFQKEGIAHRVSCPHTSQQNGKAERILRTLNDGVRTLLLHASMPPRWWAEALSTSTYLLNRRPCKPRLLTTPYELLHGHVPDFRHLRVFGCLCYPNIIAISPHKLAARSVACVFLGYPDERKGYRCYDPTTRRILFSRHVTFVESVFPFKTLPKSPDDQLDLISDPPASDHVDHDPPPAWPACPSPVSSHATSPPPFPFVRPVCTPRLPKPAKPHAPPSASRPPPSQRLFPDYVIHRNSSPSLIHRTR